MPKRLLPPAFLLLATMSRPAPAYDYQGQPFSYAMEVPEDDVYDADALNRTIWSGAYIQSLEKEPVSNALINEIIDVSMDERVLSLYTAFLALEPSDTVSTCWNCLDESKLVGTEPGAELPTDTLAIEAYPNPFQDQVTIEVTLPGRIDAAKTTVAVYDLLSRLVRRFQPEAASGTRTIRLTWDGTTAAGEQVASGIYLCVVDTPAGRQSLKLVRVR